MSGASNKEKPRWGAVIISIHQIYLTAAKGVCERLRPLVEKDEYLSKAAQREANRLTTKLIHEIEGYAIARSTKAIISPDMIFKEFGELINPKEKSAATTTTKPAAQATWWDDLRSRVKINLLVLAMEAASKLKLPDELEGTISQAANRVADSAADKLMKAVENYGRTLAEKHVIRPIWIFKHLADMIEVDIHWPVVRKIIRKSEKGNVP